MLFFDLINGVMVQCPHGKWVMRDEATSVAEESAHSASTNNDYAAALRVWKEFVDTFVIVDSDHNSFALWCKKRLNAEEPHCA